MTVWRFDVAVALNPATSTLTKGAPGNCWPMSDPTFAGSPLSVTVEGSAPDPVVTSTAQGTVPQLDIDDAQLPGDETCEQVRWRTTDGSHTQVLTSFTRVFDDLDNRLSDAVLHAVFGKIRLCLWVDGAWSIPPAGTGYVITFWISVTTAAATAPPSPAVGDLWFRHKDAA